MWSTNTAEPELLLTGIFSLQILKLSMIFQASGNPVSIHSQHTHTHRLKQCGSGRVCVAMAACCCSDVVERRSSLTRHQMCLRRDWPGGVTWEQSSQWGGKSTLCELKACQHCEQRRRGKEMQWWRGFLVLLFRQSHLYEVKSPQKHFGNSLFKVYFQGFLPVLQPSFITTLQSCRKTWKPII